MEIHALPVITAVTKVFGDGQKIVAAALQYEVPISSVMLEQAGYQVGHRRITNIYTSNALNSTPQPQGCFVMIELDSADAQAATCKRKDQGPHGRLYVEKARVLVSQTNELKGFDGSACPAFIERGSTNVENGIADLFQIGTFTMPEQGNVLGYNLYRPAQPEPDRLYPLVLFIHDAGSCSDDISAPLVQGNGAVIWAEDAEGDGEPCFVLAPHYPEVCANDNFEVTWQAEATINLVKNLIAAYPIDAGRIYGTGQSMGCMMLCELLLQHPHFFAGCLLIAGQWSPNRMIAAKHENLWGVVAQGDEKAFPILGACFDNMEQAGAQVSRGALDAAAGIDTLNESVLQQQADKCHLNFSWFSGKSVLLPGLPDHSGMHHVCTWARAYNIEALRKWLLCQRLSD